MRHKLSSIAILFAWIPLGAFLKAPQWKFIPDAGTIRARLGSNSCRKIDNALEEFKLTVAKSKNSREKGLSERPEPLRKDEGMIFIFERPLQASFWMKNTWIPLQIAFIAPNSKVVELREMSVEKDPRNPSLIIHSKDQVNAAIELSPKTLDSKALGNHVCISTEK